MKNLLNLAKSKINEYGEIIVHYTFDNVRTSYKNIEYSNGFKTNDVNDVIKTLNAFDQDSVDISWHTDVIFIKGNALNDVAQDVVDFSKKFWNYKNEYRVA